MSAYNSALHSHRHGVGQHPGDRAEFEANIRYTPPEQVWTGLDTYARSRIRVHYYDEVTATEPLAALVADPNLIYDIAPPELARLLADMLDRRAVTLRILDALAISPGDPRLTDPLNPLGSILDRPDAGI